MGLILDSMLRLQELDLLTAQKNRFLDIGPQNVYHCTAADIRKFLHGQDVASETPELAAKIERLAYFSTPRPDETTTLFSDIAELANIEYNSFDVCPALKTELLDLNFDRLPDRHRNYFDVVINFGTTEHVFNQWNSFSIMHGAAKAGGALYHVLPMSGYLDHGYYCYTPLFFTDLAKANDYDIVDLFVVPVGTSDLRLDVRNIKALGDRGETAARAVDAYNIHAIFRKRTDAPFRVALEVATANSPVYPGMQQRYLGAPSGGSEHPAGVVEHAETGEGPGGTLGDLQPAVREVLGRLLSERDALQRESDGRMRERDEKSAEILAQEAALQALRSERDQLQQRCGQLQRHCERLQQQCDIRMRERDARAAEIDARNAQIQAVLNSTSWKITQPIRSLGRLLGR